MFQFVRKQRIGQSLMPRFLFLCGWTNSWNLVCRFLFVRRWMSGRSLRAVRHQPMRPAAAARQIITSTRNTRRRRRKRLVFFTTLHYTWLMCCHTVPWKEKGIHVSILSSQFSVMGTQHSFFPVQCDGDSAFSFPSSVWWGLSILSSAFFLQHSFK